MRVKTNARYCGSICLIVLFVLVLILADETAWGQSRIVYWDGNYRTSWVDEAVTISVRDDFINAGYEILNANQLRKFMRARVSDGAKSVVVFCMDSVPDTIAESMSADCTLRRYLDAGGRIVWYSDTPLWYIAHSDGSFTTWGREGCANVLGISGVDWKNKTGSEVTLTDDGIEWGLTETWRSKRWTPADQVDIVLASDGRGNAAAWVKHFVPRDNIGGFIRIWDTHVTSNYRPCFDDLLALAEFGPKNTLYPGNPNPADGAMHLRNWIRMTWDAGDSAVSHDVYFGDNFDDVKNGSPSTFRGNVKQPFFFAGFSPYPCPEGLVCGKTYYWRIDEVNNSSPNSPWKGDVWSFWLPTRKAYEPVPYEGGNCIDAENAILSWAPGFGAVSHAVYFGDDYEAVCNSTRGTVSALTTYTPGRLELARTYYWRVDEIDSFHVYKGDIWRFTTEGVAINAYPEDGAVDVKPSVVLGWTAGDAASWHEVYFGTDANAVKNATKESPEYMGGKAIGQESYDPGDLALVSTYYWRIDEVNALHPDSLWGGETWSFTTSDFAVIDDFENYDAGNNPIFYSWLDGVGYGYPAEPPYHGNGTGSMIGDYDTSSCTEEFIVHGGNQSMPYVYNNNIPDRAYYSEAELTLTARRDWTIEGVTELSLWFRGCSASPGGFLEDPAGTFTMLGNGADIGGYEDEFHFAYKMLTGAGSIVAKIESIENTNNRAKAGVMIRETLDPASAYTMMAVTPARGISFQCRQCPGLASLDTVIGGIAAPYWVKIERDSTGGFTAYSSADGSTWNMLEVPENILMNQDVFIGLSVTSHDPVLTCQAVFTDVAIAGTVSLPWAHRDIGIPGNAAEPLYVVVSDAAGTSAIVVHDDPCASTIDTWTEWVIPLQDLADEGINLTDVDRIAIGLGTRGNVTIPGGSGKMFFDDIRLYRPRQAAE